jgi:hypothetical protein
VEAHRECFQAYKFGLQFVIGSRIAPIGILTNNPVRAFWILISEGLEVGRLKLVILPLAFYSDRLSPSRG